MTETAAHHPRHMLLDENQERYLRRTLVISLALHAVFFALFLAGPVQPQERGFRDLAPQPVEVSLVDLPRLSPPAKTLKPVLEENIPPAQPEAAPPPSKPLAPAAAAEPAGDALYLKRLAKGEEHARLERERQARLRQEEAQRAGERERLKELLASLKEKPLETAAPRATEKTRSAEQIAEELSRAAQGRQALQSAERLAAGSHAEYRARVVARVEKRWRVPANLARNRELAAVVRFELDPDGTIRIARLEESSGLAAFDDAVMRAVGELVRLDPPPRDFPGSFLVRFNNREMGR